MDPGIRRASNRSKKIELTDGEQGVQGKDTEDEKKWTAAVMTSHIEGYISFKYLTYDLRIIHQRREMVVSIAWLAAQIQRYNNTDQITHVQQHIME